MRLAFWKVWKESSIDGSSIVVIQILVLLSVVIRMMMEEPSGTNERNSNKKHVKKPKKSNKKIINHAVGPNLLMVGVVATQSQLGVEETFPVLRLLCWMLSVVLCLDVE